MVLSEKNLALCNPKQKEHEEILVVILLNAVSIKLQLDLELFFHLQVDLF